MSESRSRVRHRVIGLISIVTVFAVVVAGCGSKSAGSSAPAVVTTVSAAGDEISGKDAAAAVKAADAQLAIARKGRQTTPPSAPNAAVAGQNVWIIQSSAASPSVSIPALAAQEAGAVLGWKTTLYDAAGDPGNYTKGVSQAIANGATGIVLIAIDCSYVKNQLALAKSKNIKITEVYAFDCDDTNPGTESFFSADLSFGSRYASLVKAWEQWGSDTAAWIISATGGKAFPMVLHNEQIAVLISYQKGFDDRMAQCKTCRTINVPWDVITAGTPAAIASLMQSAVLKNPEINSSMFGSTVTSGYNQGILSLGSKASSMQVIGGLGLPDEFNLIKAKKGLEATTAWPQQWIAYAAMDSLNSTFAGTPQRDEGIGWQIIDNTNADQMPAAGALFQGNDTFRAIYKKSWTGK